MKIYLLLVFVVLTGCANEPWATASERREYGALVENSPTYRRARAASATRVIWYVEQPGEAPRIYVGFDMGTHSCREATLRLRHGNVERRVERYDGNDHWILDR